MTDTSDHAVDALTRLYRYVEDKPRPKAVPAVIVAISRQAGSGGADLARAVGARLGWPVYDREILTRIAEEKGLNTRLLEHLDERSPTWLEEIVAGFSPQYTPTEFTYLKQLMQLIASLVEVGHCVIVGRGGGHLLPSERTVRVRIVAPRALRVARTEKQQGVSATVAEHWVDQTDKDRDNFVKRHFNKDPNDPLNFDLVLNSGRCNLDDCAELIVQAARLKEARVKTAK